MRKTFKSLLLLTLLAVGGTTMLASQAVAQTQAPAPAVRGTGPEETPPIPALVSYGKLPKPANETERIAREVRHELVMMPRYSIWDYLVFRVKGTTVELYGDVREPWMKSDAENAAKQVEGVTAVVNHINVMPNFQSDIRIRRAVARSIFSFGGLSRYSWEAAPSLHIIVNAGHVKLEGVVDTQADKDAAGIRANTVPGVFEVKNELIVAQPEKKKK